MVTKAATRPSPRSSHSHSYPQHQRSASRPSATPLSPPGRMPVSVGQTLPPSSALRSSAIQGDPQVRTPSPNYFGLIVDPTSNPRESGVMPKGNWSPTTSSIFSFEAGSPERIPIDGNPDFEAFKQQTESNTKFNLSHGGLANFSLSPSPSHVRPKNENQSSQSERHDDNPPSPKSGPQIRDASPMEVDNDGGQDSAYVSSASERASISSMNAPSFFDLPRQMSPASFASGMSPVQRNVLFHLDDRHPRLSLPQHKADPPSPHPPSQPKGQHQRAETLPLALEDAPGVISPAQLVEMMDRLPASQFLLLDCRTFGTFSHSRIRGALNLCIPTTLLKRPSFTLQKLQDTFTNEEEKKKFANWRSAKYIIAYDGSSTDKKDAVLVLHTLKKFTNESWNGWRYLLKGGYQGFSAAYPKLIDRAEPEASQPSRINLTLGTKLAEVAPVAGGCLMPATKNAANPFFSNIRQNQDLIDGVGQMDVKIPQDLARDAKAMSVIPRWLKKAAKEEDKGKIVSEKFLSLEVAEQKRMTKALTSGVVYGTSAPGSKEVQIAGVEKGGKNRYNNIWPFEHTRVRLQNRPEGACDYVNASHIKTSRSNKHYIASQGPLPATFEDFWSVIWDQDVRVIVMLTAESEGGQLKCHSYWSNYDYGPLKLKTLSEKKISLDPSRRRSSADRRDSGRRRASTSTESASPSPMSEQPYAVVRKFSLAHSAHPFAPMREITQIHYSSWPDFGAPAEPSQLLALVQLSNLMQRSASSVTTSPRLDEPDLDEDTRPMLVHCSAGCGRTGTFCTVDSVIDMLKRQRKETRSGVTPIDFSNPNGGGDYLAHGNKSAQPDRDWIFDQDLDLIEKTVEDFRGQRLSMVQSLKQYVLCYETVLEWISQQYYGGSGMKGVRDRSGSVS